MLQDGIGSLVNPPWVSLFTMQRFSAHIAGSGEFLLVKQGTEDVKMVVRTINSSAFTQADWDEYVVTVRPPILIVCSDTDEKGPYNYNTKSKASWYWSRSWGACERLGCKYYVLTDYQRWVFGTFDDDKSHGYVSKIKAFSDEEPSVGQALLYWAEYVSLYLF
jgi:hypothetical protein